MAMSRCVRTIRRAPPRSSSSVVFRSDELPNSASRRQSRSSVRLRNGAAIATAPVLSDGTRLFNRTQLDADYDIENQKLQPQMIEPGGRLSDLALFERPDGTVEELLLRPQPGDV